MRILLLLSAILEVPTGIALLVVPDLVVDLLLGVRLDTPGGLTVGRLAGVALIALGTACWGASREPKSRAAAGVALGMLIYNLGVVGLLGYSRCCAGMGGVALVPAVVLHLVLALWCFASVRAAKQDA